MKTFKLLRNAMISYLLVFPGVLASTAADTGRAAVSSSSGVDEVTPLERLRTEVATLRADLSEQSRNDFYYDSGLGETALDFAHRLLKAAEWLGAVEHSQMWDSRNTDYVCDVCCVGCKAESLVSELARGDE